MVKSYLRLLLVGAVMLVLLGLLNQQNKHQGDLGLDRDSLEQNLVRYALLPLESFQGSSFPEASLDCPKGIPDFKQLSREIHQTSLLKNELDLARRISREISPGLMQRTGYFIYCCSRLGIPS